MPPTFGVRDGDPGLVVADPITRRQYPLGTDPGVEPEPVEVDRFPYPVTSAVAVETSVLRLPTVVATFVRTAAGEMLGRCEYDAIERYPAGDYVVDVHPPVKLYVMASGPFTVRTTKEDRTIEFEAPTRVRVGARSYHDRPAATVTTTPAPADVMAAVSTFGSALKTTSPERSFPTLRGHPPFVDVGDELHVPNRLETPDTGVTLELPPELAYVLPAASLAFYLGADVVPGERPALVTDEGFVHELAGEAGYQTAVERTLKRLFLLDCVTRTEGIYPVDLRERELADERLALDFADLYAAPLAERVRRYLDVDYDAIADLVPTWRLAVDCRPRTDVVEFLPFAANDLGFVRPFEPEPATASPEMAASVDAFTRDSDGLTRGGTAAGGAATSGAAADGASSRGGAAADGALTRGGAPTRSSGGLLDETDRWVELQSTDTLEAVWAGEGHPVRGGKLLRAGYEHVFEREGSEDDIRIAVVCNDEEMAAEYEDGDLYGDLETLPFEVHEFTNLTPAELREVLTTRYDFLHYIGHVEEDAFECHGGSLSVADVEEVGAFAFLLNGCRSYWQGVRMVERGSAAGIVTNYEVGNSGAITVGRKLARLLNRGLTVQSALNAVQLTESISNAYVAVGAANHPTIQMESGFPDVVEYSEEDGGYDVLIHMYPTSLRGLGSMALPDIGGDMPYVLSSDRIEIPGLVSPEEFHEQAELKQWPILEDGELKWPY